MKKGVLYIKAPFVSSPKLQDAIDNAPNLNGLSLSAPLLFDKVTNSARISSDTTKTFVTAPSLFKAVLSYLLNYTFDVSEFIALLDTLDEIRIPKITKEEDLLATLELRLFREVPFETFFVTNDNDVSTQIDTGGLLDIAEANDILLQIVKTTKDPLTDTFAVSDELDFFRGMPHDEIIGIPREYDPLTNTGMTVDLKRGSKLEEFAFVSEFKPYIVSGTLTTLDREMVKADNFTDKHMAQAPREDIVGIPREYDPLTNTGMTVTIEPVPDFVDNINSLSLVGNIIAGPSIDSVIDTLIKSDEVRKKIGALLNKTEENGDVIDFIVGALDDFSEKVTRTKEDDFFSKSLLSLIGRHTFIEPEKIIASSILEPFLPNNSPLDILGAFSIPKKLSKRDVLNILKVKELPINVIKSAQVSGEKVKVSQTAPKKVVLEFIIDETFHSIHFPYPGTLAGGVRGANFRTNFVDLGPAFDKPILGSTRDGNGDLLNGDGWPGNTQFQRKNERYIVIENIYRNLGAFRSGSDSEAASGLIARYGIDTVRTMGKDTGEIDRYEDSAMVSSDSRRIYSEGGLHTGLYGIGGFGYLNRYGPAPVRYKYSVRPGNFSQDPQPEWHTETGLYYSNQYIETVTNQGGPNGRRVNLFFREMTSKDIELSNIHGGQFQFTRGTTFIDKMLAHANWGKLFKFVDTVFKIAVGSPHDEIFFGRDNLNSAGRGSTVSDKVSATFLHRYESEILNAQNPEYDVILRWFPSPDKDNIFVNAFREWPTQYGPQPLDFAPAVNFRFTPAPFFDDFTTSSLFSSIVKQPTGETYFDKFSAEAVRQPNHIVKKPVYYRTPNGGSVPAPVFDDVSSVAPVEPPVGFIWYDTSTDKIYVRRQSAFGSEYWETIGPHEESITITDLPKIEPFISKEQDTAVATAPNPFVFSGNTLSKLDTIVALSEPVEFQSKRETEDIVALSEEGYYKDIRVGTTLLGLPIFETVFIEQPRIETNKEFLNEVAAADSGTAFVPIYCLPSYFLEAYVGEDGTHANF